MTEQLLTPADVAKQLGISEITLKRMRLDGEGPPAIFLSVRTIRYRQAEVTKWLDERKQPTHD